ncbi:MAG: hypothetical protein HXS52_03615 [Theionarchaea archaeon]|nr:hypothetical protein [Theionarchaea archaeon]MBU7036995.1 hypothetical protein [Theionarchaea archaeon]
MEPIVTLVGIFVIILGIAALFLPAIARFINFPGNEKVKSIGVIVVGVIMVLLGYFYL